MPLEFTLAIDDNPLIYKGENIVLAVNTWMWYNVVMESSHRQETIMANRIDLMVDIFDQRDWSTSTRLMSTISGMNRNDRISDLEDEINGRTFSAMYAAPFKVIGYEPADSDTVVKYDNFYLDPEYA